MSGDGHEAAEVETAQKLSFVADALNTPDPLASADIELHADVQDAIDWIAGRSWQDARSSREAALADMDMMAARFRQTGAQKRWLSEGCPSAAGVSAHVNGPLALALASTYGFPEPEVIGMLRGESGQAPLVGQLPRSVDCDVRELDVNAADASSELMASCSKRNHTLLSSLTEDKHSAWLLEQTKEQTVN